MVAIASFPLAMQVPVPTSHWDGRLAVDLFCDSGTPVLAVFDGQAAAQAYPLGGNTVTVTAGDGTQAYYAHLLQPGVSGPVSAGQVIGYADNTGNASGRPTHLHFALGRIDDHGAGTIAPWTALAGIGAPGVAPPLSGAAGAFAANPWLLVGAAVAALLLLDDDILPNPRRKEQSGFDAWQPDLFGGRGKERGEGRTRSEQMGFARSEMRDTGSPSLFESIFGAPPAKRRRIRRNLDAFEEHGVIHPIRGSDGYDPEVERMQGEAKREREREDRYRGVARERETELGGGVQRPPWASKISTAALERFAHEHGENARSPHWWERAGLYSHRSLKPGHKDRGELEDVRSYLQQDRRRAARSTVTTEPHRRATAAERAYAARAGRGGSDLPF